MSGQYLKAFKVVALAESLGLRPTREVSELDDGLMRCMPVMSVDTLLLPFRVVLVPQLLFPLLLHAAVSPARLDAAFAQLEVLSRDAPPPTVAFNAILGACSRAKVRCNDTQP